MHQDTTVTKNWVHLCCNTYALPGFYLPGSAQKWVKIITAQHGFYHCPHLVYHCPHLVYHCPFGQWYPHILGTACWQSNGQGQKYYCVDRSYNNCGRILQLFLQEIFWSLYQLTVHWNQWFYLATWQCIAVPNSMNFVLYDVVSVPQSGS